MDAACEGDLTSYLQTTATNTNTNGGNNSKVVVEASNTVVGYAAPPHSPAGSVDSGCIASEPADQTLDQLLLSAAAASSSSSASGNSDMDGAWDDSLTDLFPDLI